jgi:hypothetical protein
MELRKLVFYLYLERAIYEHFTWSYGSVKAENVTERSKTWTVFARLEAGILGSNPTQGIDVWCVYVFILCLCCPVLGRGLATSCPLAQGVLPSVKMTMKLKKGPGPTGAVEPVKKKAENLFASWVITDFPRRIMYCWVRQLLIGCCD